MKEKKRGESALSFREDFGKEGRKKRKGGRPLAAPPLEMALASLDRWPGSKRKGGGGRRKKRRGGPPLLSERGKEEGKEGEEREGIYIFLFLSLRPRVEEKKER